MITLTLTQEQCDQLELLVLAKMQHLDRINKVKSTEYHGLDVLWLKLRTPKTLTAQEAADLHDQCF